MSCCQFVSRIVPAGCAHVRLGIESVGFEPSSRQVESRSCPSNGLHSVCGIGRGRKSWTDEFGRHWGLSAKETTRIPFGRSPSGSSAIFPQFRAFRRRRRHRRYRSPSCHAIGERGFSSYPACGWSHFHRKLSLHWVSVTCVAYISFWIYFDFKWRTYYFKP